MIRKIKSKSLTHSLTQPLTTTTEYIKMNHQCGDRELLHSAVLCNVCNSRMILNRFMCSDDSLFYHITYILMVQWMAVGMLQLLDYTTNKQVALEFDEWLAMRMTTCFEEWILKIERVRFISNYALRIISMITSTLRESVPKRTKMKLLTKTKIGFDSTINEHFPMCDRANRLLSVALSFVCMLTLWNSQLCQIDRWSGFDMIFANS